MEYEVYKEEIRVLSKIMFYLLIRMAVQAQCKINGGRSEGGRFLWLEQLRVPLVTTLISDESYEQLCWCRLWISPELEAPIGPLVGSSEIRVP